MRPLEEGSELGSLPKFLGESVNYVFRPSGDTVVKEFRLPQPSPGTTRKISL